MAQRHSDSGALALHAVTKASTISAGYGFGGALVQPRSVHLAIATVIHPHHPHLVQRSRIEAHV